MTAEESYQDCMRKARIHLDGGPPHIPNTLYYAYYAVARATYLPATKRRAAMDLLQKAIQAAVQELEGDNRYVRYTNREIEVSRSEAPCNQRKP